MHLDAGEHLPGGVPAVVDDDVIAAKSLGVLQDLVQQTLILLIPCTKASTGQLPLGCDAEPSCRMHHFASQREHIDL